MCVVAVKAVYWGTGPVSGGQLLRQLAEIDRWKHWKQRLADELTSCLEPPSAVVTRLNSTTYHTIFPPKRKRKKWWIQNKAGPKVLCESSFEIDILVFLFSIKLRLNHFFLISFTCNNPQAATLKSNWKNAYIIIFPFWLCKFQDEISLGASGLLWLLSSYYFSLNFLVVLLIQRYDLQHIAVVSAT